MSDEVAIVQTVDFFAPVVDDPYVFGQIAAANALSDVYAMGAVPRTALNIVGFPDKELSLDVLNAILAGGAERVLAAGGVVVGGHSVRDAEVKFGLCVTGFVHPDRLVTNAGAKAGDVLVLTKGLGTGFITTANRKDDCDAATLRSACDSMIALNDVASAAALEHGASAMTDITGYAISGHAHEMALASGVDMVLRFGSLPRLPGVEACCAAGHRTSAHKSTRAHLGDQIVLDEAVASDALVELLFDPQTSGGLLIAVGSDRADELVKACRAAGLRATAVVGQVKDRTSAPRLYVEA